MTRRQRKSHAVLYLHGFARDVSPRLLRSATLRGSMHRFGITGLGATAVCPVATHVVPVQPVRVLIRGSRRRDLIEAHLRDHGDADKDIRPKGDITRGRAALCSE
jgi:hypothetical protein